MKLVQIQEASYHGQQETWFILDGSTMHEYSDLVGPFKSKEHAEQFMHHMETTYAHMRGDNVPVTFNFESHQLLSPEDYEKGIEEHHRDINS